jgi:hypothetical protein
MLQSRVTTLPPFSPNSGERVAPETLIQLRFTDSFNHETPYTNF